jgi:L-rhamnose mutarotase
VVILNRFKNTMMGKIAFKMKLLQGAVADNKKRDQNIWPALKNF